MGDKIIDDRMLESKTMLKEAFNQCFAVYYHNESEKGDFWRDMTSAELQTLLFMKIEAYTKTEDKTEESRILRDIVNFSLMIIAKEGEDDTKPDSDESKEGS